MDAFVSEAASFILPHAATLLVASAVFLGSALAGAIMGHRAKTRASSNARASSAFIMGLAAVFEGAMLGVIGSPFGIILGFSATVAAARHGKYSIRGRNGLSCAGTLLGVIGLFTSLFELGTVTVALALFG